MAVERQRRTAERSDVPTIQELIHAAQAGGKTLRQLEADSGGRVSFQTFQELSKNAPKNFPKDIHKTITGVALALGVPETTVVLAYAKGVGIRVTTASAFSLRIPSGIERLDAAVQDALVGLMRASVRSLPASVDGSQEWPYVADADADTFGAGEGS